ncbi:type II secretion system F family protein [Collinsella sp. zg1085]|nr:type II secretion system F family protein [Collinsella sp. zg1085]
MSSVAVSLCASMLYGLSTWGWLGVLVAERHLVMHECVEFLRRMLRTMQAVFEYMQALLFGAAVGPGLGDVSDMIDIIRLGLSAGMSFDAALRLYIDHGSSLLCQTMEEAWVRWSLGIESRTEALHMVARKLEIQALEPFAAATSQALILGAPLADTLSHQSRVCRLAHRAEVERQIERAPVKLLIPTATLILPALLLSILGPFLAAGKMI